MALLFGHGLPLRRADRSKGAPAWDPELVQQAVQIDIDGGNFQTEEICCKVMGNESNGHKVTRQVYSKTERNDGNGDDESVEKDTKREKAKSNFSSQATVRGKVSEGC